jgi:hypothetical protein
LSIGRNNGYNGKQSNLFKEKKKKFWQILLIIFSNHLNGKTRSRKIDPSNVLTNKEDKTLVAWILGMQEFGFSITLQ